MRASPTRRSTSCRRRARACSRIAATRWRGVDHPARARRYAAATGAEVRDVENGQRTIVGYDGLTFVDGLVDHNRLEISGNGHDCAVAFAYRRPDDGTLPRIGPLTCSPR